MAAEYSNSNYYISSLLRKLQSSSTSTVQKALISLSRATRKSENVVKLLEEGGMKSLLTFLKSSNKKALDMAVSILANCALERRGRTEVEKLNGVTVLCKLSGNLLASLADTSILGRVTRALANLSQDDSILNKIVNLDSLPKLLGILKESSDLQLLQSTLRALRIMGRSERSVKKLVDYSGILYLVEQLEKVHEVKAACLHTLLELAKTDSKIIGEQLQEYGGIEVIIQLTYSEDKDIAEHCINILFTITRHSSVRVSIGTMGGIEAFIHQIQAGGTLVLPSVEGVCMCCREAVSRNKIRSCGGLEVLLALLRCPEYSQVFDSILGAFVCFTYDETALKRLLACGVISTLVSILQKLLFLEDFTRSAAEKQDKRSKNTAVNGLNENVACTLSTVVQPISSDPVTAKSCGNITASGEKLVMPPKPQFSDVTYPGSPPLCLSPQLSPELRVSYMSPYSPRSACSFSPVIYSPCGSEVHDESLSECGDDDNEQDEIPESPIHSYMPTAESNPFAAANNIGGSITAPAEEEAISVAPSSGIVGSSLMESSAPSEGVPMEFDKMNMQAEAQPSLLDVGSSYSKPDAESEPKLPLLPGASFNEYLHLFLPNENLFSADQPSPRRLQPLRRSSTGPSRCTSSNSTPQSPSYTSGLYGVECKIIFLLSRFGQMPDAVDTESLTSPECIQTLLDYLCFSKNPDHRCVRLLNRLAWDRKFFETLVIIMLPGAIHRQLVRGLRPSYLLCKPHSSSNVKESNLALVTAVMDTHNSVHFGNQPTDVNSPTCPLPVNMETKFSLTSPEPTSTMEAHARAPESNFHSSVSCHHSVSHQTSDSKQIASCDKIKATSSDVSSFTSTLGEDSLLDAAPGGMLLTADRFSPDRIKEIGLTLLSILTTHACTPFGEGILAHLLLRGTQKQKKACALSLPYLCKPLRMKRKLLVDYKGILAILSTLCDSSEKASIIRAVDCLTFLVSNSAIKMGGNFDLFIGRTTERIAKAIEDRVQRASDQTSEVNQKPQIDVVDDSGSNLQRARKRSREVEAVDVIKTKRPNVECDAIEPEACLKSSIVKCKAIESEACPQSLHVNAKATKSCPIPSKSCSANNCFYKVTHSTAFDVLLKLDSGETIEAHRDTLCGCSDVFAAMLSSDFLEANQLEVAVQDISYATVLFLVHYAYGCSWSFEPDRRPTHSRVCPLLEKCLFSEECESSMADFDFLLDLLACADRFLLSDLKNQCEQLLMSSVSGERVACSYLAAACYNTPRLRVHCLQYIFLGNLELNCVYRCVVKLLESQERDRVIEDFKNIALDCCTSDGR